MVLLSRVAVMMVIDRLVLGVLATERAGTIGLRGEQLLETLAEAGVMIALLTAAGRVLRFFVRKRWLLRDCFEGRNHRR